MGLPILSLELYPLVLAVALRLAEQAATAYQKIPGSINAHQNQIHAEQLSTQSSARFHWQNG